MSAIALLPDNPRYLSYRGAPLLLVTSAEHYGAVLNRAFDDLRYLDALAAAGMNYTRIFTGSYLEKPGAFGIQRNTLAPDPDQYLAPWARSDQPGYANGGPRFDLTRWDETYFARLRDFVERAGRRGIVVEISLFSSIYASENWSYMPFHPANNVNETPEMEHSLVHTLKNGSLLAFQEALVRKLVRELNSYDNLFFELQNEPWSDQPVRVDSFETSDTTMGHNWQNQVDAASDEALAWQRSVAGWIVSEEQGLPNRHLIAQNYCNFRMRLNQIDERVSILNFHYAWPEAALWNAHHRRVVSFDESGFSGAEDSAYRKQAWRFILAGGGIFNNLDYSFSVGHEDGTSPNQAPGGGSPMLRRQLRTLREFVEAYDFTIMQPASEGRWMSGVKQALAYVEQPQNGLRIGLPSGRYRVTWLDPVSGELAGEEAIRSEGDLEVKAPAGLAEAVVGIRPA